MSTRVKTIGFYMHHIYSDKKKRLIIDSAKRYELKGLYKFGKPGRVIIQSTNTNDLKQFTKLIKAQTWQICTISSEFEFDISINKDIKQFEKFITCETDIQIKEGLIEVGLKQFWLDLTGFKN
ncbi:hypothetical protein CONCODRAFT_80151 [Conidiobolus coronatus NRRL 28638]|uniref:Small nuclear ribonucleoprotein Prp3 C-terminal domain-containing protein n=1 Tax=Conidiobolus coronatus (strain ATCC 28846 / CBS 209.66 / NRRL 28638) TaxID=796925 RepID=A0A137NXA8_CONC2|nr:hypothetical protein CONCODRAFT_80151 [Conidiobolus coronatus NRRL 28638]|eukprot:KXN67406.1 hypothetical protein CONCODRAFT_80151 [Conidiobolus coronatus NRRL 28638]